MASTYTPLLRAELIGTGDQAGSWSNSTNSNLLNVFESAIAGAANITVTSADYTLSQANNAPDEARMAVIRVAGTLTGNRAVIVPSVSKPYLVYNGDGSGFTLTVKTAAGTGVAIPQGSYMYVYCDATNVVPTGAPTANPTFIGTVTAPTIAATTGTFSGAVTINGVANQGFTTSAKMAFNMAAAPTGWTQDTSAGMNDTMMRIVNGAGAGQGGSQAFSTWSAVSATAAYTLTTNDIPAHTHGVTDPGHYHVIQPSTQGSGGSAGFQGANWSPTNTSTATTGITINANTTTGTGHSHGITRGLKYNDFMICQKAA